MYSPCNYIVYVVEGRKIWHTGHGSFDMQKGSCMLVRKGACIVEQFFDTKFCLVLFFIPDEFICDVLKTKATPLANSSKKFETILTIDNNAAVQSFFNSMLTYFDARQQPDSAILDLKFRELVLTIADNPVNAELISYFCALVKGPKTISLQQVMEENFRFNLKLEGFAELSARSLSAFKRDFELHYKTTPAKWLLRKRLEHAHYLLSTLGQTVGEASFESGFENTTHFSRVFSKHFGVTPASVKQHQAV